MPSICNLASPLYPQGNLLPFAHDSVTRLWKANLQTVLKSMSRAGDRMILMTEVSSLLPDSAYFQEIKPPGLRKPAFQASKDREKPILIFPTTFSPRSRSFPRFSARGNLFRTIHSERLIWLPLLLLSRVSRVQLCATPETAAPQAYPSLGFSRQEHWSGLPFPSVMQ